MKKILSIALIFTILLAFTGCDNENEKRYRAIEDAYDAFVDDQDYVNYECGDIDEYVFYDGDDYYRVKKDEVKEVKPSSNTIGNRASDNEYEGYYVYFYEGTGVTAAAHKNGNQAEIKNAFTAYCAEMAMDGTATTDRIEDLIYSDGQSYYDHEGKKVNPALAGQFIDSFSGWLLYYKVS